MFRSYRPSLPLLASSLVAVVAIWGAALSQLNGREHEQIAQVTSRAELLAKLYQEEVTRVIEQTDRASRQLKAELERNEGRPPQEILNQSSVVLPHGALLAAVVDREGRIVAATVPLRNASGGDRPFFRHHQEDPSAALEISAPVLSRLTGQPALHFTRRLNARDGSFNGVLVLTLNPAALAHFAATAELGPEGVVALVGEDHIFRVRLVGDRLSFGDRLDTDNATRLRVGQATEGVLASRSPLDQIHRIYAYRHLDGYPLLALAGISDEAALHQQDEWRPLIWGLAIGATVFVLFIYFYLERRNRELESSRRRASQAEAVYRAAAEGSLDAFYILEAVRNPEGKIVDFVCTDLNERGARLLRRPRDELLGCHILESFPAYRHTDFFETYVRVVETQEVVEQELEVRHPQIHARWLHRQIVPLENGIALTTRDITARKESELAQRQDRTFLSTLIDNLPQLVYVRSLRPHSFGQFVVWNQGAQIITGYRTEAVVGKTAGEAFPDALAQAYDRAKREILASPMIHSEPEMRFIRADGTLRYLKHISIPIFDEGEDHPSYILSIGEDVTVRRQHELELRDKKAELEAVNDASPLGLFRTDPGGFSSYVNQAFERITGQSREQAIGSVWTEGLHPDDRAAAGIAWDDARRERRGFSGTYRYRHGQARTVWASIKASPILIDGALTGYVGSVDDVTRRREADIALRQSEARLRTVADTLPMQLAYLDADLRYRFVNRGVESALKRTRDEILGRTLPDIDGMAQFERFKPYIQQVLEGEPVVFEDESNDDGQYLCRQVSYLPQRDVDSNDVIGFHLIAQDITRIKLSERRLRRMAEIDPLTGLLNRAGFERRLDDAIHGARQLKTQLALLYIDIDRFKQVNDSLGHLAGDQLLKQLAQRLRTCCTEQDVLARLGGDEFTVVMTQLTSPSEAQERAQAIVRVMREPYVIEGRSLRSSGSVGIALFEGDATTAHDLLRNADEMLYQAKGAGRDRLAFQGQVFGDDS